MEIEETKFVKILDIMRKLDLFEKDKDKKEANSIDAEKMLLLIENYEDMVLILKAYKELCEANTLKAKSPAIHKELGTVLIKQVYHGIVNNKFTHSQVRVITLNGEIKLVPYSEIIPFNKTSEVLYAEQPK